MLSQRQHISLCHKDGTFPRYVNNLDVIVVSLYVYMIIPLINRRLISSNLYRVFRIARNIRYIQYNAMHVIPTESAWKDHSNHTKYPKSPNTLLTVF